MRPSRWDTRMALPEAERLLEDPLALPDRGRRWKAGLQGAEDLCGLLAVGSEALGPSSSGAAMLRPASMVPSSLGFDPALRAALEELAWHMALAGRSLDKAVRSLTREERRTALSEVASVITNETGPRSDPAAYDAMTRFEAGPMLASSRSLCERVRREAIPAMTKAAAGYRSAEKRWKLAHGGTALGDALVAGPGERTFTAEDLKGVALLVHLGGKSVYQGPVAAAGEGEVKVVIDLAADVTIIDHNGEPTAGSGIFGIGLLFLPDATGTKKITGGDLSMGAGLFGVGGLFIESQGAVLQGGRFTQGAGAFGVGALWSRGDGASFKADLASQGYGFTRGAGLFSHRGPKADLACGLRYPDPREALAAISLCQGMGYGHRAFSGGGIGLAYVEGNDSSLATNYFGQGSGYWHGIGALFVRGDRNRLKARRYSQGAGIHTAVGILAVEGSSNTLVNWGVGPAFGWDYGVGYWVLEGDDNSARADWGTGRGDVNGHGLAAIRGDRNRLLLPEFATGFYKRGAPGYGLASIQGRDNRLGLPALSSETAGVRSLALGSWGTVVARDGLTLDPKLTLPTGDWPAIDRAPAVEKERAELGALLAAALGKSGRERLSGLLHVTSSFSLDAQVPRAALRELFRTPVADLPLLEAELSPDRFDDYIWLRVLLAGFGPEASAWAVREFHLSTGTLRVLLVHATRYGRAEQALPFLAKAVSDPDWRVRREAAGSIGYLFNREEGDEPGRLPFYEVLASSPALNDETFKRLGWKRAVDVMSALALAGPVSSDERARLADSFPGPNEPLPKETLSLILDLVSGRKDRLDAILSELSAAARLESPARELLFKTVRDADRDVAAAALGSLGAVGRAEDAALIAPFLSAETGKEREAAASGLARMGPAGRAEIRTALTSGDPRGRMGACKAAAQSWDPETLGLLAKCLSDPDAGVRASGAAAMSAVQGTLQADKKRFRETLRKLAQTDPEAPVRAASAFAASQIAP